MAIPSYIVRHSTKAKHLRLKVTPQHGLCVIVPRGFDETKVPAILHRKKEWIEDALANAKERRRFLEAKTADHLPEKLVLTAIGEHWSISYRDSEQKVGLRLQCESPHLMLSGKAFSRTNVLPRLRQWLRKRVSHELTPLAYRLAMQKGFHLGKIFVKNQRTRWASFSARGNLALNVKLLFLSPELVRYAVIHELCHSVHMNHSKDFWRLVEHHEPSFRRLDDELRAAWKMVPPWLF
jgi:predicted metal-dependent hydrolase